ncbi:hypothetical protein VPH35_099388 [Triticum aestivum]|uniref:Uncharacterized protein n=1 Tax=Aegilops tauschii subsp. strangulata TaxID=200361 RepID=A0A453LJY6_AEGTS
MENAKNLHKQVQSKTSVFPITGIIYMIIHQCIMYFFQSAITSVASHFLLHLFEHKSATTCSHGISFRFVAFRSLSCLGNHHDVQPRRCQPTTPASIGNLELCRTLFTCMPVRQITHGLLTCYS